MIADWFTSAFWWTKKNKQ